MRLMLSFGMNTNPREMSGRCPAAVSLGRYDLFGYRLVFRGVADIVESPGDTIQCVLWDITDECERELDILEGYPYLYEKAEILIEYGGEYEFAMFYYMTDSYRTSAPSDRYLGLLVEGYKHHGLSLDQIYNAEGFTHEYDSLY